MWPSASATTAARIACLRPPSSRAIIGRVCTTSSSGSSGAFSSLRSRCQAATSRSSSTRTLCSCKTLFRALEVHLQAPLAQHSFRLKKFRFMYQPTGPWEGGVMRHPAMPKPKLPRGNDAHDPRGKHGLARYGRPLCGDLAAIHPRHELNSGQMFVPDRHLVHTILQAKPLSFRASSELDQQVVSKLLHLDLQPKSTKDPRTHRHPANSSADGGFSACMLPEGFTEHCWCRNNITCAVDICSMVTYHATCFSTFNQKYAGALAAVERFEQPACRLWRREFPL